MDFLKSGAVCYLREAENENRRSPFDLYSVYDGDTLVCIDTKEPLRIAEISSWFWQRESRFDDSGNGNFFRK